MNLYISFGFDSIISLTTIQSFNQTRILEFSTASKPRTSGTISNFGELIGSTPLSQTKTSERSLRISSS